MSSSIIEAGNDGSRVRKFVSLKEAIEALLNDFFVSEGLSYCEQSH